ncbi:MAG: hypothetical protein ACOCXG_04365 [Nanoarchaeota archaeon]
MSKIERKYGYREVYVNQTYFHKFYNKNIQKTKYEILINTMFLCAILGTITMLTLEFLINIPNLLHLLHLLSLPFLMIFAIHLTKEYAESPNLKHFLKKHGLDFFLISFLGFYLVFSFLFSGIFYLFKIHLLKDFKDLAYEAKNFKVIGKIFRR